MFKPKPKFQSIADIIAPMTKVVTDLRAFHAKKEAEISNREAEADAALSRATAARVEADRASALIDKYAALVA